MDRGGGWTGEDVGGWRAKSGGWIGGGTGLEGWRVEGVESAIAS